MSEWVKLCSQSQAPSSGSVGEYAAGGVDICLANTDGKLSAVDNWCPHRRGPLGQGWLEDGKIVCPWHAWAFALNTGDCPAEHSKVAVFPLKLEGDDLLVQLS